MRPFATLQVIFSLILSNKRQSKVAITETQNPIRGAAAILD